MLFNLLLKSSFVCTFIFIVSSCDDTIKQSATSNQTQENPVVNENFTGYAEIKPLEEQLKTDSLNIPKRNNLAALYYAASDFEKAIYHFNFIYKIDKSNTTVIVNLGNLYYDTKQYAQAIEFYEKYLIVDNKNINVRCDMATCYLNIKQAEKAEKILKENITLNYNHIQSHYNLSIVYKQLGKVKESEEEEQIAKQLSSH